MVKRAASKPDPEQAPSDSDSDSDSDCDSDENDSKEENQSNEENEHKSKKPKTDAARNPKPEASRNPKPDAKNVIDKKDGDSKSVTGFSSAGNAALKPGKAGEKPAPTPAKGATNAGKEDSNPAAIAEKPATKSGKDDSNPAPTAAKAVAKPGKDEENPAPTSSKASAKPRKASASTQAAVNMGVRPATSAGYFSTEAKENLKSLMYDTDPASTEAKDTNSFKIVSDQDTQYPMMEYNMPTFKMPEDDFEFPLPVYQTGGCKHCEQEERGCRLCVTNFQSLEQEQNAFQLTIEDLLSKRFIVIRDNLFQFESDLAKSRSDHAVATAQSRAQHIIALWKKTTVIASAAACAEEDSVAAAAVADK